MRAQAKTKLEVLFQRSSEKGTRPLDFLINEGYPTEAEAGFKEINVWIKSKTECEMYLRRRKEIVAMEYGVDALSWWT